MPIIKNQWAFFISLWLIISGCTGSGLMPTVTPKITLPSPTATNSPVPTAVPSPTPTLTPTPVKVGQWECYQGGLVCYNNLFTVSMLNDQEGWAGGVLHYTNTPGQVEPSWQLSKVGTSLTKVVAVGPDEWWGVDRAVLWHYKDGTLLEVNHLPGGSNEGLDGCNPKI